MLGPINSRAGAAKQLKVVQQHAPLFLCHQVWLCSSQQPRFQNLNLSAPQKLGSYRAQRKIMAVLARECGEVLLAALERKIAWQPAFVYLVAVGLSGL